MADAHQHRLVHLVAVLRVLVRCHVGKRCSRWSNKENGNEDFKIALKASLPAGPRRSLPLSSAVALSAPVNTATWSVLLLPTFTHIHPSYSGFWKHSLCPGSDVT